MPAAALLPCLWNVSIVDTSSLLHTSVCCRCHLPPPPQAAYPYVAKIYRQAIPTIVMMFLMTIASTWLLMHAASQWARTRTEAKLLHRIPHAAKHALALQHSQQYANGGTDSSGAGGAAGGKGVGGKGSSSGGGEGDVAGGRLSNGGVVCMCVTAR